MLLLKINKNTLQYSVKVLERDVQNDCFVRCCMLKFTTENLKTLPFSNCFENQIVDAT